jgi:hypothetical protein
MVEVLFGVLMQGLKLWNHKEGGKYLDRVIRLKSDWTEEYSKPRAKRNNSNLDEIELELVLIAKTFTEMGGLK